MLITICKAQEEDAVAIGEIDKKAFSEPWPVKEFTKAITNKNYYFLVAKDKDRIVGYAGVITSGDESDITNIAVELNYRQCGIATELLKNLCEQLSLQKVVSIFLEVRESNKNAIHLYEAQNFKAVGMRKNFYSKPDENAIIMKKIIDE